MATRNQIIRVGITDYESALIERLAPLSAMGGSHFRKEDGSMSPAVNLDDQIIMLIGECGLSKWLTGSPHGFMLSRWLRNRAPGIGDGGMDYPGLNVDIKATRFRPGWKLARYWLVVHPKDWRPDWVYVLGVVARDRRSISLVGWAPTSALPAQVKRHPPLNGRYVLPSPRLFPLQKFRWLG